MIDRARSYGRDLIRRSIVRTGAVYGALSFVALQLGETLIPPHGIGSGGFKTLFAALLGGFPLLLAAAWLRDIGATDPRRPPETGAAAQGGGVAIQPSSGRLIPTAIGAAVSLSALGWWLGGLGVPFDTIPVGIPSMFVSAAVLLVAGWWWSMYEGEGQAEEVPVLARSSIAVLPFVNDWGPAGESSYLGDALTDEIRDLLGGVAGLHFAAQTSCFTSPKPPADVRIVGRKLGISTLLEGSVLRNDAHMRVTAQLIDVQTGSRIWSGTYGCELDGSTVCHSVIARAIVGEMLASRESSQRKWAG